MRDFEFDEGTVRAAIALASRAPSTHNTQPWICRLGASSLHLYADLTRWLPATDADRRDLIVSCGTMLHHLEVSLASFGVDVTVHRLPNPADPDHLAALELRPGRFRDSAVEDAAAILRRRTDRRPFGNFPLPEQHLDHLVRCASERGAVLRAIDQEDGEVLRALLRDAAEIQEEDPAYQSELALWSGRAISDDGIPNANLLGQTGQAWNGSRNFPIGQIEIPIGAAPDQAAFLVLGTTSDDRLSQLRAGEALSAVLLRATALGLASCPLSQPLEVSATRLRLRDEVLGGTASPQVVLRIGWPHWGTPLPITPRRAIDDFVEPMPPRRIHSEPSTHEQNVIASPHRPLDFWLKLVDTLINMDFRTMLEEHGIIRRQWEMLRMLSRAPASQDDLDAALAPFLPEAEPGSSAAALSELTDSGWLTQINDRYQLTERGRVVHRRLDEVFSHKNQELAEGISPDDYALVVSVLQRIAANLGWRDPAAVS